MLDCFALNSGALFRTSFPMFGRMRDVTRREDLADLGAHVLSLGRKRGAQFIQVEKRERKEGKGGEYQRIKELTYPRDWTPNCPVRCARRWANLTYLGFRLRADCSEEHQVPPARMAQVPANQIQEFSLSADADFGMRCSARFHTVESRAFFALPLSGLVSGLHSFDTLLNPTLLVLCYPYPPPTSIKLLQTSTWRILRDGDLAQTFWGSKRGNFYTSLQ